MVGRSACRLCEGTGLVSRQAARQWRRDRERRLTGQFEHFEAIAQRYIQILEDRRTDPASALAREGRRLVSEFERAAGMPPGSPERSSAIRALFDYQAQVIEFLRGGR